MNKSLVEILLRTDVGAIAKLNITIVTSEVHTNYDIFQAIAFGRFDIVPTEISKQHLTYQGENANGGQVLNFYLAGVVFETIPLLGNFQLIPYICAVAIPEKEVQVALLESKALIPH